MATARDWICRLTSLLGTMAEPDGALDLHDDAMGDDVGYYPDWVQNTHCYLGAVNPTTGRGNSNSDVNVIIWSWCGQASGLTEQQMIRSST